ncbi:MAG TPA: hypothetical protein VNG93_08175 [Candidatus Dormibacteraeota bacterium]|nr:hypothetical protein [Candidatus Dormibacteraeota bacterium]
MNDKQEAALDQVEEGRLLPGERPDSQHPDDALHWAEVYRELRTFKEETIDRVLQELVKLGDVARYEIESTDLVVLRSERDRFQRRAEFWRNRYRTLTGKP